MNCLFSVPRGPWFSRARVHNPPVDTGAITPPAPSCSLVFDTTFGWYLEWHVITQRGINDNAVMIIFGKKIDGEKARHNTWPTWNCKSKKEIVYNNWFN